MPVIRRSDETMRRLKTWSQPLEDAAESALAKVLDAVDAAESARIGPPPPARPNREKQKLLAPKPPARPRSGAPRKLPQKALRQPLLEVLHELGGSALVCELRPVMKERVAPLLLPGDWELVSMGDERWWNATRWERSALLREGYLRPDSPRGVWELSDKGLEHVANSLRVRRAAPFVEHLLTIPDVGDDTDFERDPSSSRYVKL